MHQAFFEDFQSLCGVMGDEVLVPVPCGPEVLEKIEKDEILTSSEEILPTEVVAVKEEDTELCIEENTEFFEEEDFDAKPTEYSETKQFDTLEEENIEPDKPPDGEMGEDSSEQSGDDDDEDSGTTSRSVDSQPEKEFHKNGGSGTGDVRIRNNSVSSLDKDILCERCGETFYTRRQLRDHDCCVKPFKCDVCLRSYPTLQKFKRHMDTHDPVLCEFCGKSYNRYSFPLHMNIHKGERPHICSTCGLTFRSLAGVTDHIARRHKTERPLQCTICEKRFLRGTELRLHMKRHLGQKSHMCEVCGKAFLNTHNLKRHREWHIGKRPFQCTLCEKDFVDHNGLVAHLRTHTKEKPYKCDKCEEEEKCFRSSRQLKAHIRSVHTGERPYSCHTCGRSFVEKRGVRAHVQTHGH